jgi:methionyl-tRNA formyltransferase
VSSVVFLGSDDVAALCLERLAGLDRVALVVTPPDRRRGRRRAPEPTPVRATADRLGLPVLTTAKVSAPEPLATLAEHRPDLLVVVSFGQILSQAVLDLPALGALNLHFSLLPRWRGAAPVQRAILAGDVETGVAVQRMVLRLDAGAVLAELREPIGPRDTTPEVRARLGEAGSGLLLETARAVLAGSPPPAREQDESLVTLAPRIRPEEGLLDFAAEDGAALDRRVRALQPWPGCRTRIERAAGKPVDVLVRAALPEPGAAGAAGSVLAADAEGLVVAARSGALRVTRVQRAGKGEVDVRAFLNGVPVRPGDRFVPPLA